MNECKIKNSAAKLEHLKYKLHQGEPLREADLDYALGLLNEYLCGLFAIDDCVCDIICKLKNDEPLSENELLAMDVVISLKQL